MDNLDKFDLDRSAQRAWLEFRDYLAGHIAAMIDDEVLILGILDEEVLSGNSPYVRFTGFGNAYVRSEVASNYVLAYEYELMPDQEQRLTDAGWNLPRRPQVGECDGSANYFVELDRDHADQAATMAVAALQDVFGIEHPIFLESEAWNPSGLVSFGGRERH